MSLIIILVHQNQIHYAINNILKGCDEQDPPSIVIDEVVGMWISCIFINNDLIMILVAFSLFRLFDIFKPFPIGLVDRNFKNAFGIIFDDILAGIYCILCAYFITFLSFFIKLIGL